MRGKAPEILEESPEALDRCSRNQVSRFNLHDDDLSPHFSKYENMTDNSPRPMELKPRQWDFLQAMMKKYHLPDESKAVRCLIDHALSNPAIEATIFGEIRCRDC